MKEFFISYNSADEQWATWIAWQLEAAGHSAVIQAWDFRPGSNFALEMQKAASEAERTIAVLSPSFLKSSFTQPEWAAAFARDPTGEKGVLLPVRIAECELHGLLSPIVYIDLFGKEEAAAKGALLAGIKRGRQKPQTAPKFPARITPPAPAPRFPGQLPPIWNLPYLRNPNFTGRDQSLRDLRAALQSALQSAQRPAVIQAIAGLGGVGKTQLAIEYAYRNSADYSLVWWVRAETAASSNAAFAELAQKLDLPEAGDADQTLAVNAAKRWLEHQPDWLLILDNAAGSREIADYLPHSNLGHVIITSRNPTWGSVAQPLRIKVFSRETSIQFLSKRSGQEDRASADALCNALGDLPLALAQAGAYVEATGISLASYLTRFQKQAPELLKVRSPAAQYPDSVATTWKMSFDQLRHETPAALDLLNLFAYLAPDEIPRALLEDGAAHLPPSLAGVVSDPLRLDEAIGGLRRYSLVEAGPEVLTVHRLVQTITRDALTAEGSAVKWAETAVRLVDAAFPFEQNDVGTWEPSSRLLPHVLMAATHADELNTALETSAHLFNNASLYLQVRAELDDAEQALRRALRIEEKVYGPDDSQVAIVVNNLGIILQAKGDLEGAQRYIERALRIDEEVYGPDHPNVAIRVNNLGLILKDKGDLEGAQRYTERALRIDEEVYGPDHPKVAIRASNLGQILKAKGDLEGAQRYSERALRIHEKVYGPDHPSVAIDANNLGQILQAKGDLEGARRYTERALRIDEKIYGPDHPKVAIRVSNLGQILKAKGDLEGAQRYTERALRIDEKVLGPGHPSTKIAAENLRRIRALLK